MVLFKFSVFVQLLHNTAFYDRTLYENIILMTTILPHFELLRLNSARPV